MKLIENWTDVSKGKFGDISDDAEMFVEREGDKVVSVTIRIGKKYIKFRPSDNLYTKNLLIFEPTPPETKTIFRVTAETDDGGEYENDCCKDETEAKELKAKLTDLGFDNIKIKKMTIEK